MCNIKIATWVRRVVPAVVFFNLAFLTVDSCVAAQLSEAQQLLPTESVDRFCKLDAEGKQLTAAGAKEIAPLLDEPKPRALYPEVVVIKDYAMHVPVGGGEPTQVSVAYDVWGRLDSSSLRFTLIGGPFANRATLIPELLTLARVNSSSESGAAGQIHDIAATPAWRISRIPTEPHINVSAAMHYVRELGYRSRDPLIRMNAQRTLSELQRLSQLQFSAGGAFFESEIVFVLHDTLAETVEYLYLLLR